MLQPSIQSFGMPYLMVTTDIKNTFTFFFGEHLLYLIFIPSFLFSILVRIVTSTSYLTFPSFMNGIWQVYLLCDFSLLSTRTDRVLHCDYVIYVAAHVENDVCFVRKPARILTSKCLCDSCVSTALRLHIQSSKKLGNLSAAGRFAGVEG